jgi:hypothetical protein
MTSRPMNFEMSVILQSMEPPAQLTSKVMIEAAPSGRDESTDWPADMRNAAIYTRAITPPFLPVQLCLCVRGP